MPFRFIVLLLLTLSVQAFATKTSDWGWGAQPIIGYDDQNGWTFGANNVFYWDPDTTNKNHEVDELDLTTTITTEMAYNVHGQFTKYFEEDTRNYTIELGYERYFTRYYGTSEATEDSVLASSTAIDMPFSIGYLIKPFRNINIQPQYELHLLRNEYSDPVSDSIAGIIGLVDEDFTSGLGLSVEYNNTNPGIYKRTGYRIAVTSVYYGKWLGSRHNFELVGGSYKHYIPLGKESVLAWQVSYEQGIGDVPNFHMPTLGGNKILRGFDSDKYKGKYRTAAQMELRFPIVWRVGGTAFVGAGNVDNRFQNLVDRMRVAGGLGIRFMVQTKQKINIRFDFTYSNEKDVKKYIKIKEAF